MLRRRRELAFVIGSLVTIIAGAIVRWALHDPNTAYRIWFAGLVLTGVPVIARTVVGVFRGQLAADLVASLAIAGAILLGEPLAGLVVVLMQTGGELLERYAEGRASRAVRELEEAAPRTAHVIRGGTTHDVEVSEVKVGDHLLIRPGELIPCDGIVVEGRSHVDVSRLTGEPVPVTADAGTRLLSGSANQEGSFTLRATALAAESQYARIVQLVREAQASKSPLQRIADRYAVWFTPFTLLACAIAYAITRDPTRVLAVLVVATPCPLILATPIAIIGGVNRAARAGLIVRHGGALEALASVRVAVFDKTGTLTIGQPAVSRVTALRGFGEREVLTSAAAVEHRSGHLLARAIVDAAVADGIAVTDARHIVEAPGRGVSGLVDGRRVSVGAYSFVVEGHAGIAEEFDAHESHGVGLRAYVVIDGRPAGVIDFADQLRPGASALVSDLASLGIARMMLLSGDHAANAHAIATAVGIGEVIGDMLPEDKVEVVRGLVRQGERVLMVGDGTNDAPALSAATVGIAIAAHGGGISAEAADAVLLTEDLTRVARVVRVARRTMRVARQSIGVGIGLSGAAMIVAAAGYIPPTVGALIQEAIDVAVIVNALRASRAPRGVRDDVSAAGRRDAPASSPYAAARA
jgi:heavy metal translocating P-type ATPase